MTSSAGPGGVPGSPSDERHAVGRSWSFRECRPREPGSCLTTPPGAAIRCWHRVGANHTRPGVRHPRKVDERGAAASRGGRASPSRGQSTVGRDDGGDQADQSWVPRDVSPGSKSVDPRHRTGPHDLRHEYFHGPRHPVCGWSHWLETFPVNLLADLDTGLVVNAGRTPGEGHILLQHDAPRWPASPGIDYDVWVPGRRGHERPPGVRVGGLAASELQGNLALALHGQASSPLEQDETLAVVTRTGSDSAHVRVADAPETPRRRELDSLDAAVHLAELNGAAAVTCTMTTHGAEVLGFLPARRGQPFGPVPLDSPARFRRPGSRSRTRTCRTIGGVGRGPLGRGPARASRRRRGRRRPARCARHGWTAGGR